MDMRLYVASLPISSSSGNNGHNCLVQGLPKVDVRDSPQIILHQTKDSRRIPVVGTCISVKTTPWRYSSQYKTQPESPFSASPASLSSSMGGGDARLETPKGLTNTILAMASSSSSSSSSCGGGGGNWGHMGSRRRSLALGTLLLLGGSGALVRPHQSRGLESSSLGPPITSRRGPEQSNRIVDTSGWFRYQGDGFELSVPPSFEDTMEADDYGATKSLYGERAKAKMYAARFVSSNRSEVLSVVIRQASKLKLSFLEAQDITDLGSLREASRIFVPSGAKLFAARTIKTKDSPRTYYYYEFSTRDNCIAMEAAASKGMVYVVGASAPLTKWKEDAAILRSAAVSFSLY